MNWFYLIIAIPFLSAFLVPFIYKKASPRIHTGWFVLPVPAAVFGHLLSYISPISHGVTIRFALPWIPAYNINLTCTIDGLSLVFGLIISGMGFLVILYSVYYMSKLREALHNFMSIYSFSWGDARACLCGQHLRFVCVLGNNQHLFLLLIAYWFERKIQIRRAEVSADHYFWRIIHAGGFYPARHDY